MSEDEFLMAVVSSLSTMALAMVAMAVSSVVIALVGVLRLFEHRAQPDQPAGE